MSLTSWPCARKRRPSHARRHRLPSDEHGGQLAIKGMTGMARQGLAQDDLACVIQPNGMNNPLRNVEPVRSYFGFHWTCLLWLHVSPTLAIIVAHRGRSAQGRVHFINSRPSLSHRGWGHCRKAVFNTGTVVRQLTLPLMKKAPLGVFRCRLSVLVQIEIKGRLGNSAQAADVCRRQTLTLSTALHFQLYRGMWMVKNASSATFPSRLWYTRSCPSESLR